MGKIAGVRLRLTLIAFTGLLSACADQPAAMESQGHGPVQIGETFTLTVGDSARVGDSGVLIIFDSVVDDSRCPRATTCVWEGNARVRITLLEPQGGPGPGLKLGAGSIELNTSEKFTRKHAFSLGSLELRALSPQPPVSNPKAYVATLYIEPAE